MFVQQDTVQCFPLFKKLFDKHIRHWRYYRLVNMFRGARFVQVSSRRFWTKASPGEAASTGGGGNRSTWFGFTVRHTIRAVQVGILSFTIYQYGFQSGVLMYMKDHEGLDQAYLQMALQTKRVTEEEDPERTAILTAIANKSQSRLKVITLRIIHAARELLEHKLILAEAKLKDPDPKVQRDTQREIEQLLRGQRNIAGHWNVVIVPNDSVNAFVVSLCPNKIFVMAGLIAALEPTDDELAMIIAHELSHTLSGHGGADDYSFHAILIAAQLMILSFIDPTGFSIFFFDYLVQKLRSGVSAVFSREHEEEADTLGVSIGMIACFDMKKGANIMKKLADAQKQAAGEEEYRVTQWLDDHPASMERYLRLLKIEEEMQENVHKEHPEAKGKHLNGLPHCHSLVTDLKKVGLWYWFE